MAKKYVDMSKEELTWLNSELQKQYEDIVSSGISLDLSRGKPSKEQLDVSEGLFSALSSSSQCISSTGFDVRNYGLLQGVEEARNLFADLLGVDPENILVGGNSSLTMQYDAFARCMLFGVGEHRMSWIRQGDAKILCPSPGYDRHFAICEEFRTPMIPIRLTGHGPDMDQVEELVANDPTIKGMFCVPKYSNPTGETYDKKTIRRIAELNPAAKDFRIFWDNAYLYHDFGKVTDVANIFDYTKGTKNEDMVFEFFSTSKITFPGSGVAVMASSKANIEFAMKHLSVQSINSDKINQMRHVIYIKNAENLREHMKKHAAILKPKFELVEQKFHEAFDGTGIATWTEPNGGYFISLDIFPNTAKTTFNLCKAAGLKITCAGATFPYKKDPESKNLRICPSYASAEDLEKACEVLAVCAKLAATRRLLEVE